MTVTLPCHPAVETEVERGTLLLAPARHRSMELLEGEPLWVHPFDAPAGARLRLTAARSERLGMDACLVHPDDLAKLLGRSAPDAGWSDAVPVCDVSIESAKPLYPQAWAVQWRLPAEEDEGTDAAAASGERAERCVVCLDVSGSMDGEKIDFAKVALFTILDRKSQAGLDEEVGLVTFGDESPGHVSTRLEPTPHFANPEVTLLIEDLEPYDGTPLHEGLEEALRILPGGELPCRRVLLVTDGWGNVELEGRGVAALAAAQGAVIDCVGIGEGCNQPLLENLARRTGGRYREVKRYWDLVQRLEALAFAPAGARRSVPSAAAGEPGTQRSLESEIEARIVDWLERERKAESAPALALVEELGRIARQLSSDRIRDRTMGRLGGSDPSELLEQAGYGNVEAVEKSFWSHRTRDPADSVRRAADADGFREELVSGRFAEVGVGVTRALDGTVMTSVLLTAARRTDEEPAP